MAKKKGFNIMVDPEKVVHTTISRSDDYSAARMAMKLGDKAYMSVSVEWEGDMIPDFAMNMMAMMTANEEKSGVAWSAEKKKNFDLFKKKKKDGDDEEDMDKKDKKKEKKKK